ncbi:protein PTST, chloroplastic isoform X1 [Senna tora]|uniref:Protein PTST, chloroplastic isoform X1 n=1 Tax=Senna tora TaxID=362788 RepID=A0A834TYH2_9FABA|nr:protein PTST, chloroplastic isoform X1 [Senna tora]
MLASDIGRVTFLHNFREANTCADWLAKFNLSSNVGLVELADPPSDLMRFIARDKLGISSCRDLFSSVRPSPFIPIATCRFSGPSISPRGVTVISKTRHYPFFFITKNVSSRNRNPEECGTSVTATTVNLQPLTLLSRTGNPPFAFIDFEYFSIKNREMSSLHRLASERDCSEAKQLFMMEISTASLSRCCLETQPQALCFSRISRTLGWENNDKLSCIIAVRRSRLGYRGLASSYQALIEVYPKRPFFCRPHSVPTSLEESTSLQSESDSSEDENASADSEEEILEQPLTSEQIAALLADTERLKLTKKLSEANQQNRFLKRQLYVKEEALVNFKSELAVMELEVQALVKLSEEIAKSGIPEGSRKINGKYIQSHLISRLEAMREKLKEQIKDVDSAKSKEVHVFWVGMAESVQVMGTFDGWSQGEHLSPEYDGSFTKFSSTLMLRPGRYEIKFLVDGEWQLSPEFPTVGEGLTKNNLLVVE